MMQIPTLDVLLFILLPPAVGVFFLVSSEMLLYMMKKYIRAGEEGTSSSRIVTWYGESYNAHGRFWNAARYISWTLGASIVALWLQAITGNDNALLVGLFLMFRFAIPLSISDRAKLALMTKEEREAFGKDRFDLISWRVYVKHLMKQSDTPAEDLRRSITKMREQDNPSRDVILQILESLTAREDEVGAEARLLMSEI